MKQTKILFQNEGTLATNDPNCFFTHEVALFTTQQKRADHSINLSPEDFNFIFLQRGARPPLMRQCRTSLTELLWIYAAQSETEAINKGEEWAEAFTLKYPNTDFQIAMINRHTSIFIITPSTNIPIFEYCTLIERLQNYLIDKKPVLLEEDGDTIKILHLTVQGTGKHAYNLLDDVKTYIKQEYPSTLQPFVTATNEHIMEAKLINCYEKQTEKMLRMQINQNEDTKITKV